MSRRLDTFLRHIPVHRASPSLGRVYSVTRESWRLSDDPVLVAPKAQLMVTGRTAADAADFARRTALTFSTHGFHKPSASWWASDEGAFHRYVVHVGRRRPRAARAAVGAGILGVAALGVVHLIGRRRGKSSAPERS